MEEKTFFGSGGVTVTNARFITKGQTYARSGITSVKYRQDPSRTGPFVWGAVAVLAMLARGAGLGVGLAILAMVVLFWWGQKSEFSVLLTTSSGEVKALVSRDGNFIAQVVAALNESIVHRG